MNRLYKAIGATLKVEWAGNTATFFVDGGRVDIVRYSDSTLRITQHIYGQPWPEMPYAVIGEPDGQPFMQVHDTTEVTFLHTPALHIAVSKNPLRISAFNAQGKLVMENDPGLGMGQLGDTVFLHQTLFDDEKIIGLGEKTGPINRRGQAFVHWNTDHFGYPENADPIYLSTPFYISLRQNGCHGFFLNNSHRSVFNFGASNDRFSIIQAEGGLMDYFLFVTDTPAQIISQYTALTGRMPLPPLWALGYQQCRYSYYPETEVLTLARTFRDKQIPCDVVYLDIHHMANFKVFTFDEERFPNPKAMHSQLRDMGFRSVVIADPGIKRESGYPIYDSGTEADVFVKYPDGKPWAAQVWPGWSHFPDFTTPKGRNWWANHVKFYTDHGVSGLWNDMNEPASWGQNSPDVVEFGWEGNPTSHREAHNVYGMLMARASRQGVEQNLNGERPFLLTRAGFSGVQRYSAVWTGDNVATDAHMLAGVRLVNSLGMAGIAFSGYDVGGFVGEASPELYARWISIGAFSPLFRGHSMIDTRDSEPWTYGETVEAIARNYIALRYKLLPTIYSAMHTASQTGLPLARSLAMLYPANEMVFRPEFQDQYFFGDSLMICPVSSTKHLTKVYLPEGDWYDFHTDTHYTGNQVIVAECGLGTLPIFVNRGAPILTQSAVQHTAQRHNGVLEIHVWFAAVGIAKWYEDDGVTNDHLHQQFALREVHYNCPDNLLLISAKQGQFTSNFRTARVIWHGFTDRAVLQVEVNGEAYSPTSNTHRWLGALPTFDPLGTDGPDHTQTVFQVEFPLVDQAMELRWVSEALAIIHT